MVAEIFEYVFANLVSIGGVGETSSRTPNSRRNRKACAKLARGN
jgi:hypothetical protein